MLLCCIYVLETTPGGKANWNQVEEPWYQVMSSPETVVSIEHRSGPGRDHCLFGSFLSTGTGFLTTPSRTAPFASGGDLCPLRTPSRTAQQPVVVIAFGSFLSTG